MGPLLMQSVTPKSHADRDSWEQRHYWQGDALREITWWYNHHPIAEGPEIPLKGVQKRDFCYKHGTAIYQNLGCSLCGQRYCWEMLI